MSRATVRGSGRLALSVALAAAAAVPACASQRAPAERVVLALASTPNAALVHLAIASGDFAAEGLEVEVRAHPYGQRALEEVVEGRADLATVGDTPLVLALVRGHPLRVLASLSTTTRGNALLVRAGGQVSTPKDLAGRRVGLARGTSSEFFLERVLARSGLRPEDVATVDVRPEGLAAALDAGEIDAAAVFPPYSNRIRKQLGPRAEVLPDLASFTVFSLVASAAFAERRAAVATRVLRALLRAEQRIHRDRRAAMAAVARATGMDPGELGETWEELVIGVELDQSLLVLLEQQARWLARSGRTPRGAAPDLRLVLDPRPLRAVSPSNVHLMW